MSKKRIAVMAGALAAAASMMTAAPASAADRCDHHSAGWECYAEPSGMSGTLYLKYNNGANQLDAGYFVGNNQVTLDYSTDNGRTWNYIQSGYSQSSYRPADQHRLHRACIQAPRGWHCTPGRNSMP